MVPREVTVLTGDVEWKDEKREKELMVSCYWFICLIEFDTRETKRLGVWKCDYTDSYFRDDTALFAMHTVY